MQIIVSHIPPEGLHFHLSKDGQWFHQQLSEDRIDQFSVRKIDFLGMASRVAENVSIKGRIEIEATALCSRCLESFVLVLEGDVLYVMLPEREAPAGEETELEQDDLDLFYYKDDCIDLEAAIVEQGLLLLPIKPLCSEDCRGLCPVCGINLNKESCDHQKDQHIESPFAALKNFKIKGKRS